MDSDERYGAELLRPLIRTPRAPSTVDIARAIAEGERRQRTVRLAGVAAVVLAVALVVTGGWTIAGGRRSAPPVSTTSNAASPSASPESSTPTGCVLKRLAVPAGQPPKSVVTGADPTGRFILGRSYPGGESHPLLIWDNGAVTAIAMSGADQELRDITTTGVAVGTSFIGASTAAWVYRNGKVSRLAGGVAEANAINDRETIVGSVNGKPALWSSPTAPPTMLALPAGDWRGHATGIDEDGTIIGELTNTRVEKVGYLWRPGGAVEKLPVPSMRGTPVNAFSAIAIRDGWVIGWAALDQGHYRYIGAPRWNLRTGEVDTSLTGLATGINKQGWVVGQLGDIRGIVADGHTVPLPDLGGPQRPGGTIPYTISDDGTVVAGQVDLGDLTPVAVRWNCH